MLEKTCTFADKSTRLGLRVHRGRSKGLKNNAAISTTPTTLEGDGLEGVASFTYLGNIDDKQRGRGGEEGGGGGGLEVRIGRARAAFLQMKNIWASPNLTINIKVNKTCPAVGSSMENHSCDTEEDPGFHQHIP